MGGRRLRAMAPRTGWPGTRPGQGSGVKHRRRRPRPPERRPVRGGSPKETRTRPGARAHPGRPSWSDSVERFVGQRRSEGLVGELWLRRMRWELLRVPRLLRALRAAPIPSAPLDFGPAHLAAIRAGMPWEKPTFAIHFAALRPFLKWAGHPLGADGGAWRLPSGEPSHRRWLTRDQLVALLAKASGAARLLVGLEGLNGLRRVEALRLRVKDVFLPEATLRVLGKGRNGGRWRRIPLHPALVAPLGAWVRDRPPDARVLPYSRSGADLLLQSAARAAGFPDRGLRVSHHDLRRTFGRLAAKAGMNLVQIKNLLGHASVDMTAHYIGLDADEMREGLGRLAVFVNGEARPRGSRSPHRRRAPAGSRP